MHNKNILNRNKGFVLVLTVMIVSASVLLISFVINRVAAYKQSSRFWIDKQKAELLALGGIQIAMSQLDELTSKPKNESKEALPSSDDQEGSDALADSASGDNEQKIGSFLLSSLNTWQNFELKESIDGVDGECSVYISSENGKINLNALYDAKTKKFVTVNSIDAKKMLDTLSDLLKPILEKARLKPVNMASVLEGFFRNHTVLDDVTQLFSAKEMKDLGEILWVTPDMKNTISVMDLFTVSSNTALIDPFQFSSSLAKLLGLQSAKTDEKFSVKDFVALVKLPAIDWQKSWSPIMEELYGKNYSSFSADIKAFFNTRFEPTLWSVVSYGKVGLANAKVCAVIEKNKTEKSQNVSEAFLVRKLYWL